MLFSLQNQYLKLQNCMKILVVISTDVVWVLALKKIMMSPNVMVYFVFLSGIMLSPREKVTLINME